MPRDEDEWRSPSWGSLTDQWSRFAFQGATLRAAGGIRTKPIVYGTAPIAPSLTRSVRIPGRSRFPSSDQCIEMRGAARRPCAHAGGRLHARHTQEDLGAALRNTL